MVSHNAMFYWYEPLLEYIEEEAKVMVKKLASMQEYGTDFVIRRHNEIIEDTEIIFNNTQPFSQFKFRGMNILSSVSVFKNTHVFFIAFLTMEWLLLYRADTCVCFHVIHIDWKYDAA